MAGGMNGNAALKSNTSDTKCPACDVEIVLVRSFRNVISSMYQCPNCGATVKYFWGKGDATK